MYTLFYRIPGVTRWLRFEGSEDVVRFHLKLNHTLYTDWVIRPTAQGSGDG